MTIYKTPFESKTLEGFLSPEECEEIIYIANKATQWDTANSDFWDNKVLNDVSIYSRVNVEVGKFLIDLRSKIADAIQDLYGLNQPVYSDVQQVVRWYPGMEMSPHSDNMENTDHHEHHRHRAFGVVIYLNDNYSGGHTYYPQHDISIAPKTGMLAVHPSDVNHMHGVSLVSDEIRYTLVSFWTFEKDKQQDLSHYL